MGLKTKVLKAALAAMSVTGFARAATPLTGGRGIVLTMHHVRERAVAGFAPNAHLEITPAFLAAAVRRIRARGLDIVDLDEAARRLASGEGARFAVLTLDDGYRDNLLHALPVLKTAGAPFTVYVATGLIDRTATPWWIVLERVIFRQPRVETVIAGRGRKWPTGSVAEKYACFAELAAILTGEIDEDAQRAVADELSARYGVEPRKILAEEMMTWDELRRLAAEPLVTIAGHTVGHYAIGRLPLGRARDEIVNGAKRLETMLGRPVRHFSFPYGYAGAAGARDFALLADLGFTTAVTTVPGMLTAESATALTGLPRVSLNGNFQSLRTLDVFLSGAPFALRDAVRRLLRRKPPEAAVQPAE